MLKYYTRACNFYYGKTSLEMVKKKLAFPLHGNRELSFDTIEILSRKKTRKINIKKINSLSNSLKKKIKKDLINIRKKKVFCKINLQEPLLVGVLNLTPDSFSDGGKYNNTKSALNRINLLLKAGCKIIDIGGESTRPGSKGIDKYTVPNREKSRSTCHTAEAPTPSGRPLGRPLGGLLAGLLALSILKV